MYTCILHCHISINAESYFHKYNTLHTDFTNLKYVQLSF